MADTGAKRAATISRSPKTIIFGNKDDENEKAGLRTTPCTKRVCQTLSTLNEPKPDAKPRNSGNKDEVEEQARAELSVTNPSYQELKRDI